MSRPVGTPVAADDDPGPLLLPKGDVLLDPLLLPLGDQRPDLGAGVGRIADLHPAHHGRQGVDDLVVTLALARMRVWATQACPLFISEANWRPSIVDVRSASSRMIAADLPPSSRLQRFSCSPQIAAMRRPAAVDPVKATLSTPGWRTRCSPASRPAGTMLTTPGGNAGLVKDVRQQVGVQRGLGRRLEHDRAPREQGRGQLGHGHELRDVPRDDGGHHARPALGAR